MSIYKYSLPILHRTIMNDELRTKRRREKICNILMTNSFILKSFYPFKQEQKSMINNHESLRLSHKKIYYS